MASKTGLGKEKIKIRIPLSERAGHPIGTKKGKRGYNRKRERRISRFYLE
jgi:hypothetical protein